MTSNSKLGNDPIAYAIVLVGFAALGLFAFLVAVAVAIPVGIAFTAGFFGYRYWKLQQYKITEFVPDTIKDRPQYLDPDQFRKGIEGWLLTEPEEETGKYSSPPLADAFYYVVTSLYREESFHEPPLRPNTSDQITIARHYDRLEAWQRKVSDQNNFELFMQFLVGCYMALREHFPPYALQSTPHTVNSGITTQLQIRDEPEIISKLVGAFFDEDFKKRRLFGEMRRQIEQNAEIVTQETFAQYFASTPLRVFAKLNIPIEIFDEVRFAGMWCCAPQGMGKTTLLHCLIASDVERDASIIMMDSKGELIQPFMKHPALAKRVVVIGPDSPVGMNPLDVPKGDINKTVESLEYFFASLADYKLTGPQSMVLKATLRALITVFPNPTLATFQDLLARDGEKRYAVHIAKLEPDLKNFFQVEYNTENIRGRRQEISQRLRALLDHDLIRAMFTAPRTTFHIAEAMDQGAIVIIDANRGKLSNAGSEFFQRFFIAQVLAAAQSRSFRPDSQKKPVYFYIDEAHTAIRNDERITDVYHECRSQKIALCCAHQETTQVSDKVLSALQNCAIRFSRPDDEARKMSIALRMPLAKLLALREGQFGMYVRGLSKEGIVVNVHKPDLSELRPSKQPYRARRSKPPAALDESLEPVAPIAADPREPEVPAKEDPWPDQAKPQSRPSPLPPKTDDSDFSPTW